MEYIRNNGIDAATVNLLIEISFIKYAMHLIVNMAKYMNETYPNW